MTVYRYIRYEQRRNRRYPLPVLTVEIVRHKYWTADWSLGGMLVRGYRGVGCPGLHLASIIHILGVPASFAVKPGVMRIDHGRGLLAVRFLELSAEAADLLGRTAARRLGAVKK